MHGRPLREQALCRAAEDSCGDVDASDTGETEVSGEVDADPLEIDTVDDSSEADAEIGSDSDIHADTVADGEDVASDTEIVVVTCADEGLSCEGLGECGAGIVECVAGVARCSTEAGGTEAEVSDESCDGLDNDCDGLSDEDFGEGGVITLEGARFGGDEGAVKGEGCGVGACAGGVVVCGDDGLSLVCDSDGHGLAADTCNGADDDCDGITDNDFVLAGTLGFKPLSGAAYPADNGKALGAQCGTGACASQGGGMVECAGDGTKLACSSDSRASVERCDNVDNDCNGSVDEPFVSVTGTTLRDAKFAGDNGKVKGDDCGVGACVGGRVICAAGGAGLVCDGDMGASGEVCDRVDNDCDGTTDIHFKYEDLALGAVCDGVGECGAGVVVCTSDKVAATCSTNGDGTNSQARAEVCDGVDNNCDGQTDEGLKYGGAGVGGACNGVGECGAGVVQCNAAGAPTCSTNLDGTASQAAAEVCNSLDDDCDGVTDDNCSAVCNPICQNNGACQVGNTCDCAGTGYSGNRCQTPVCAAGCGLGTCSAPGTCNCDGTGYSGSRCETPVCSSPCLNGGTCTGPNTCTCPSGWTGARCEQAVCNPSCGAHGTCTSPGQCTCASNWTGNRCDTPVCTDNCNANGTCVGAQQCSCYGGWSGARCETALCTTPCGAHGNCWAPDTCTCNAGWSGTLCNQPVCLSACQNGGTCIAPDVCSCPPGLSGLQCQNLAGFVKIPAGTFTMGSPTTEVERDPGETQHSVTLTRAFWIKATEVTQGEWQALMGSNPSGFSSCGANCPVEMVNYYSAIAYVNALSASKGLPPCYTLSECTGSPGGMYECDSIGFGGLSCTGYRLPTEAEWEYAARAATTTATYNGNITQTEAGIEPVLQQIAWYIANGSSATHPVGAKNPNAWGLYDMLGNVAEWVHDLYLPYGTGPVTDPTGSTVPALIMIRGGAWSFNASSSRSAWRQQADAVTVNALGFRVARTAP